jgi:hypothetical protein
MVTRKRLSVKSVSKLISFYKNHRELKAKFLLLIKNILFSGKGAEPPLAFACQYNSPQKVLFAEQTNFLSDRVIKIW